MAKKSKKEEVMKEVSSVDKKIAKLKAVIKKLEDSKQIMAINHNKPQDQIPPIAPPQPDNITGNLNNNLKVQQLGASLFEGEALAGQEMAKRNLGKPVMPPSPDPMGDQYGNMFNQPFAQNKIEKALVLEKPRLPKKFKMEPKKEKPKMYLPSIWRETTHEVHLPKLEKPKQIKEIQRVNMEGPLAQNKDIYKKGIKDIKYKMPLEGVQDLQDMGAVKEDEKGQYVVNENATSVSDTLRFPPGTKHYSGRNYKKGELIDESDYEDIIKKVNKS